MDNCVQRERQFLGVWIPKELWFAKELSLQEKCFLAEIHSLDKEEGCIASNNHFSTIFNLSKNRCSEIIKKLEKIGAIKIRYIYNDKKIEKRIINVIRLYGLQKKIEDDTYSISRQTPSESRQTPSENLEGRITNERNIIDIYDDEQKNKKCKKLIGKKSDDSDFFDLSFEEKFNKISEYCKEKNYDININHFVEYYETTNWHRKDGVKIISWKLAVCNWANKDYNKNQKNGSSSPISSAKPQDSLVKYEYDDTWEKQLEEKGFTENELIAKINEWKESVYKETGEFDAKPSGEIISKILNREI